MSVRPRLADVRCSRITFQPGDRVLVRSHHRMDEEQKRRLKKSIVKWAGCSVEVYIYCVLDMEVEIEHAGYV